MQKEDGFGAMNTFCIHPLFFFNVFSRFGVYSDVHDRRSLRKGEDIDEKEMAGMDDEHRDGRFGICGMRIRNR